LGFTFIHFPKFARHESNSSKFITSVMTETTIYSIPARFRRTENLHILMWLLKDLCWAMLWKPLGVAMLVPTLVVAVLITWQTRRLKAELFHNLAVVCWITANGYWMITEFFWENIDALRYYTAIPFCMGLGFIALYYLIVLPREGRKKATAL
jgi:prepilin signal peptidase PulO-like enzyme (type II secretory pathway)